MLMNRIFLFQLIDNSLADIAEGSDIIGKYFEVDHRFFYSSTVKCPSCGLGMILWSAPDKKVKANVVL
ncbi:hypothetical protein KN63_07380 [Smithella sp. F21]|nr:hypothetical protein KN63_07380 [Smithella sp. F21]HCS77058.1 hypothetical protein [Syntrophaceae bacterium]